MFCGMQNNLQSCLMLAIFLNWRRTALMFSPSDLKQNAIVRVPRGIFHSDLMSKNRIDSLYVGVLEMNFLFKMNKIKNSKWLNFNC